MSYVFSEFTRIPQNAKEQMNKQMWDYKGSHLSILETSHRSENFGAVTNWTMGQLRTYLQIPANYKILLMQGGVELVWASIPYNLYFNTPNAETMKSLYVLTGPRSQQAAAQAEKIMDETRVVSVALGDISKAQDKEYLYSFFCMNDIDNGCFTESIPDVPAKYKIADCSSVLGLRPIKISDYAIVIGSAQHSLGMTGCTVTIVREDLVIKNIKIPSMFSYEVMVRTNSIFNTPNCFAVYVMGFYVNFLIKQYGSTQKAAQKMKSLYDRLVKAIDPEKSHLTIKKIEGHIHSVKSVVLESSDPKRMEKLREKLEDTNVIANHGKHLIVHLQLTNTLEEMQKLHDLLQE